eukprot:CAMPEP_0119358248 /NCGR_PEP_ID=MMETSP1334-20130426/6492_1 /TAXON_ID=127549 /ORGANISM="Calcidiscus leptoporus, Strain RCC1130" /LENGTH=136 /DNA_ID=CAMNT_0007372691 /DNA_START=415 /DNA_END=822 /DNA_ORIENTATION=+
MGVVQPDAVEARRTHGVIVAGRPIVRRDEAHTLFVQVPYELPLWRVVGVVASLSGFVSPVRHLHFRKGLLPNGRCEEDLPLGRLARSAVCKDRTERKHGLGGKYGPRGGLAEPVDGLELTIRLVGGDLGGADDRSR